MRLAVLKERHAYETRVAATPETVKKLIALGLTVAIEAGAGQGAAIADADFQAAGAEITPDAAAALNGAKVVFAVQLPEREIRAIMPRGVLLVCTAGALGDPDLVSHLAQAGIDTVAMELLPRITRAQSMDVLSSQANLAGYRAVIEGAGAFERGFAMMMTAAGTVPPARVFVIGAGVAGLAGHRHRPPPWRHRVRDGRPAGGQGGDQVPRRQLRGRRGRGDRGPDRRLREGDERRVPPEAGGADGDHRGQERHRRLHRPRDGPPRPDHRDRADGGGHAGRQRRGRPRRRRRRQLRR